MRFSILAFCTLAFVCFRADAATTPVWVQVSTPHFTVISNASERQARHVAGQFERMQAVFQKLLPNAKPDAGSPIIILAVKNRRDFQALLPTEDLSKGSLDLAGLFLQSSDRNYILVRLDAGSDYPYSTVYHEYTHYITRHENLPVWLNEGIAEFYQSTDIDAHEIRFGQPSAGNLQLLRTQNLLSLETLFDVDHDSPYYHDEQKGTMFYAESWALTYMLYFNDLNNRTTLISNYVKALSSDYKQTPLTAAVTAFGDLKKLQSNLSDLIAQSSFQVMTLPITIPNDEASYKVTPLAATDADAYRAAVLVANFRSEDAQKLIDSILAADPNNALAHETEGILQLHDGDLEDARKSYSEAVALHSNSFLAWYYAAVLSMRMGDRDASIETDLQQCLKLNPQFAAANDALSGYYAAVHKNLDQALSLSVLAVTQDPDKLEYRFNNASLHMERGEIPDALSALEKARAVAHTPQEVAELDGRVEQIYGYQERQASDAKALANQVPIPVASSEPDSKPTAAASSDGTPLYPDSAPSGPRHLAKGVLHNVRCTSPMVLTLTVNGGGKRIALYTNHLDKIDYWVTFYPEGGLDPCKIEGMKAIVAYTDVKDARVAGQIVSIRVSK